MKNFWENKPLADFTREEWESVCDRCAKCCLHKIEDEESGEVFYTSVACGLLDVDTCACRDYRHRKEFVPECIVLSKENLEDFGWLPSTCAYRKLYQDEELEQWHPLLSKSEVSVHESGVSIRSYCTSEKDVDLDEVHKYVLNWKV